ncbi:DUF2934 domain-containing protein [Lacibacterium aquatile]|uniref:DUF2934 domain-containing protein n=1 Tax=Lacibacterium aquatile TaxID=1168082 RepID=A0ABW5DQK1_9PROT
MADYKTPQEERIAECAYTIWVQEGKPSGSSEQFWDRAIEVIALEENADISKVPIKRDGVTFAPLEPQNNQVDFPELTERSQTWKAG